MDNAELKGKTVSGLVWRFAERCGSQGVSFIVSIILARLLEPEVYGTVALVTVLITVLQVFVDSGLGNSLIQKKEADELDFSTVFYFNVIWCLVIYFGIYMMAPYIAAFYDNQSLVPVIRVQSLIVVVSGLKNVQQAYVAKKMIFKRFFFATLGGTIGAAIVGIFLAYKGYGVWALVAQQLFNTIVDTIILWITVDWHPKRMFSFCRLKQLFSYGWKLLLSALIATIYGNVQQLIIGVKYTTADLAYYNKGRSFPSLIVNNINISLDNVLLSTFSTEQDYKEKVKHMTRKSIRMSSYILWPILVGLAVVAKPLISLLLTDTWISCVPFLQVFCIVMAFEPINLINLNAIKAMGDSGSFLKLEIIKKVIGIVILILTMRISVKAIAYGLIIVAIISLFVNVYPNKRLFSYTCTEMVQDIKSPLLLSCVMGGMIWPIQLLGVGNLVTIMLQVILGGIVYLVGSRIFKIKELEDILTLIRGKRQRMEH